MTSTPSQTYGIGMIQMLNVSDGVSVRVPVLDCKGPLPNSVPKPPFRCGLQDLQWQGLGRREGGHGQRVPESSGAALVGQWAKALGAGLGKERVVGRHEWSEVLPNTNLCCRPIFVHTPVQSFADQPGGEGGKWPGNGLSWDPSTLKPTKIFLKGKMRF